MPNPIKYTAGTETQALKKGNFFFGSGDVGKGPTSSTGFYAGVNIPSSGYTVYLNNNSLPGGLSYFTAGTDASLISQTNSLASTSFTSVTQCLTYYAGQTDKICFNIDYPPIVTSGLVLNMDAAFVPSYPQSGSTWYGVGVSGYTGTLTNGPTFNSDNGGSIVFDGTDDTLPLSLNPIYQLYSANTVNQSWTISMWLNILPKSRQSITTYTSEIGNELLITAFSDTAVPLMWTDGTDYLYGNTTVVNKGWCNLIFQFSGDNTQKLWNIYLNGILDATKTKTISNAGYPALGSSLTLSSNPINGKLSQFLIYNRILSSSEIIQNYEAIGTRYVSLQVQSLVVAGGGGGGGPLGYPSGGGGAGGLLTGITTSLSTNTNYTITVGGGGAIGQKGSNSIFNNLTSYGGGNGGTGRSASGGSGGSGGGGATNYPPDLGAVKLTPAGSGTLGQGNDGGVGKSVYNNTGPNGDGIPSGAGGGGGAGAIGGTGTTTPYHKGGDGGVGLYFSEYSSLGGAPSGWFAGGGGGANNFANGSSNSIGLGANGGGGNASANNNPAATPGGVNTGGGGGGCGYFDSNFTGGGSAGGSGIVILRIPDVYTAKFSSGVTSSVTKSGGYKYYKITATSTTSETVSFS